MGITLRKTTIGTVVPVDQGTAMRKHALPSAA
jgi:hypothetical protein